MARIDITEFERLVRNSKLSERYKLYAKNYVTCIINTNKGKNCYFVNNEDFLKVIEVILNYKQQDSEIYTLLTSYTERYIRLINNSKLGKLISYSKLDIKYKLLMIEDITYVMNTNKEAEFSFFNNEDLLKAVEVILDSPMQQDMKYLSVMGVILCLKDNNEQQKSSIILYALLTSYGVIIPYIKQTVPRYKKQTIPHAYTEQTTPHALYIKRPNNKKSDVKMSDYLLDSQMIKEDISCLKKTDQEKFKELCGQIEEMQGQEVKETFNGYCSQINSQEKREALKYTAAALAVVCVVAVVVTVITGNATAGFIAAVTGITAVAICGYLCSSKLECVELHTPKNPPSVVNSGKTSSQNGNVQQTVSNPFLIQRECSTNCVKPIFNSTQFSIYRERKCRAGIWLMPNLI